MPAVGQVEKCGGMCAAGVANRVCGAELVTIGWEAAKKQNERYIMTGQTGSFLYMAPEVVRCDPYDEKVLTLPAMPACRNPFETSFMGCMCPPKKRATGIHV